MDGNKKNKINLLITRWSGAIAVVLILFAAIFLYFDRGNGISVLIQRWGVMGIILAVLLMAAIFMTPVPSEGLVIIYFKIYGVYFGTLYSWIGSIIGSLALFIFARFYGQNIVAKLITKERFEIVNTWVAEKGTFGLFIARLLPIPTFFANFIFGIMPSIKTWPYLWTTSISIIPYFVGMAMIFMGIDKGTKLWLILGIVIGVASLAASYFISKRKAHS